MFPLSAPESAVRDLATQAKADQQTATLKIQE